MIGENAKNINRAKIPDFIKTVLHMAEGQGAVEEVTATLRWIAEHVPTDRESIKEK